MGMHSPILPRSIRANLEAEIELHLQRVDVLIARLDRADGDPDLEPDDFGEDDDPREDGHDAEQTNEDGTEFVYSMPPIYALDQSAGPVNGQGGWG